MIARITGASSGIFKLVAVFTAITLPSVLIGHFLYGIAAHIFLGTIKAL